MNHSFGHGLSRRSVLGAAAATLAVSPIGAALAQSTPRFRRYNVRSAKGHEMLKSYAVAVKTLMALKPEDPNNWFRNAFTHTLDCPHGNWWFFVWHRGYLGWFEQTLRTASGNPEFAIPYWDWTESPRIPAEMFDGVLNPSNPPYNPFIKDYQTFYDYLNPAITAWFNGFTPAQHQQLETRMMPTAQAVWKLVKGDPTNGAMFATTPRARYITAASPDLDEDTQKMVAPDMVLSGLAPTTFANFNSIETTSHNKQPAGSSVFGILEGNPHNKVHNNIGGVGHLTNPLDYGYMADNLSPVDPLFFLHHSNMDRLWDVWTRKQQKLGLPILPPDSSIPTFDQEPFLFFVNSKGVPVAQKKAGDYAHIGAFDYDYEPGFGEQVIGKPALAASIAANQPLSGKMTGGVGAVTVPPAALQQNATSQNAEPLVVQVTIPHPTSASAAREFDVLINAPAGTTQVKPDSPYYAGTISFFGFMRNMTQDATFTVPLPKNLHPTNGILSVQVIPHVAPSTLLTAKRAPAKSVLKAVTVKAW